MQFFGLAFILYLYQGILRITYVSVSLLAMEKFSKEFRIDIGAIKELLGREVKQILWTRGSSQLANCLTKRGVSGGALLEVIQTGRIVL